MLKLLGAFSISLFAPQAGKQIVIPNDCFVQTLLSF